MGEVQSTIQKDQGRKHGAIILANIGQERVLPVIGQQQDRVLHPFIIVGNLADQPGGLDFRQSAC